MSGGSDNSIPETAQERTLASIAQQAFARNKETYGPIVQRYITNANVSPEAQTRGLATASTEQAFGAALPRSVSNTQARGGDVRGTIAGMNLDKTSSRALGGVNAINAAKNLQLSRLNQVIGFGRGQATQAVSGIGQTGEAAQETAMRDAQLSMNERAQIGEGLLGGASLAYGATRPSVAPRVPSGVTSGTFGAEIPQVPQLMGGIR
jgi:hypothetical protein